MPKRERYRSFLWSLASFILLLTQLVNLCDAGKFNRVLKVGDAAPAWGELKAVDGRAVTLDDFREAKAIALVFYSNRCPMSEACTPRLIELTREYEKRGVVVVAVSIGQSVADRFEAMQFRAKERQFPFLYVQDASQQIGRRYGATCTPHAFVLDAKRHIAYMGAIDDGLRPGIVPEETYLRDALDAVLQGQRPEVTETRQTGCDIEYRS